MCPACLATALIAAGVTCSGGLAAFALKCFFETNKRNNPEKNKNEISRQTNGNRIGS